MRCPKCQGRGVLPEYYYVSGGECFLCHGTGEIYTHTPVQNISPSQKRKKRSVIGHFPLWEILADFQKAESYISDDVYYVLAVIPPDDIPKELFQSGERWKLRQFVSPLKKFQIGVRYYIQWKCSHDGVVPGMTYESLTNENICEIGTHYDNPHKVKVWWYE